MARKIGKKGYMVLKVDLAKAYDRIGWEFLHETLQAARLPDLCIKWIMECVTSTSYQVLWNGGETDSFTPSRGLRQGCPLSPYLFTLCIERLSHCIGSEVKKHKWKPVRLSPGGPALSHLFFADDLVLFAEASIIQADIVMECLNNFCLASGEMISKEKSRVFFSRNVKNKDRNDICNRMGIQATTDLGRYLGVPVLHGRITKSTYKFILDRIDQKLTSWKARTLSLAGRVTLAVSVLNALPTYAMQTTCLPLSICDAIDRKVRSFVWGSIEGKRKTHLVAWDNICKPKSQGGLGLKSARHMNMAYMIKLGWHMLNNASDLWVQVLQGKYFKHQGGDITTMKKSNHSNLWKAIVRGMRLMREATCWSIRDGRNTLFWKQPWIDHSTILADFATTDINEEDLDSTVADWVTEEGKWDWNKLGQYLPNEVILTIAGVDAPDPELGEDVTIWGLEKDGRFSLKSAYRLVADIEEQEDDGRWKAVWKWRGPSRIKHFLWLATHERLLTNKEREKRKLTTCNLCNHCNEEEETIEHILRKCKKAKSIWETFQNKESTVSRSLNFTDWLLHNIKCEETATEFGIICWQLWKQRNEEVMEGCAFKKESVTAKIKAWFNIVNQAQANQQKTAGFVPKKRTPCDVGWKLPEEGWIQLHSDGSFHAQSGKAAAGGLFRDHLGRCLGAYVCNFV
ncbi:unnamed protein product [Linum trigynum]|uniref:Reverse transcriptase domain-containing protein n=1 Tax=Linum trigynum TaxID=586398 RepID=A0AAV2FJ28_9ROSI